MIALGSQCPQLEEGDTARLVTARLLTRSGPLVGRNPAAQRVARALPSMTNRREQEQYCHDGSSRG